MVRLLMEQDYIWNLIAKKLSGEASAEELRELEGFLRKNPDLHYSLQTMIDLWHPGPGFDEEKVHRAFNRHLERMQQRNAGFSAPTDYSETAQFIQPANSRKPAGYNYKKVLFFSALSIVTLTVIFFTGIHFSAQPKIQQRAEIPPHNSISEISTKNGSKTSVVLPDGTKVWLNAGSTLSYDKNFDNILREVNLTGEAFFDVIHNAEKPFIIHTSKINIRVLGTKFNVKSYPADKTTEADLIRGSIEVSFKDRPTEKIILKPNQKIVVANEEKEQDSLPHTASENARIKNKEESLVAVRNLTYETHSGDIIETSWVENKLIFQDESFEDIAGKLERSYAVSISFSDPQLKAVHLTGVFTNETVNQALDALKLTASFNYLIEGNHITIVDKK